MSQRPPAGAAACPACGALNDAEFGRCIRCGLSPAQAARTAASRAAGVDDRRAGVAVDARSLWGAKVIGGLTFLVFAAQFWAMRSHGAEAALLTGGERGSIIRFGGLEVRPDLVAHEPWRLLSAVFVHFGILHFGMNMLGLMNLARFVEPAIGSARFTIAYVLTGIAGFATTMGYAILFGGGGASLTAGASGAVFGVMGLALGFLIRRRDPQWKRFAIEAVLFSVLIGFTINAANAGILVNNSAHLGGLVTGTLLGAIFAGEKRAPDAVVNVGAGLSIAACLAALLLAQLSSRADRFEMPDPFSGSPEGPTGRALVMVRPSSAPPRTSAGDCAGPPPRLTADLRNFPRGLCPQNPRRNRPSKDRFTRLDVPRAHGFI